MSFESHIVTEASKIAQKSAEFAFRHPLFLGFAIDQNAIAKMSFRRLTKEQPNCPAIPQILRTLIESEKKINRTLLMAVVSDLN